MKFMSRQLCIIGGLGLALGACSNSAGPAQEYRLGASRANFHDYTQRKADLCGVDPRPLADELGGVNTLLAEFLSATEKASNPASVDHARHLELLKEASGSLGKVLDVHQANLKALQKCDFATTGLFPELGTRGQELVQQSRSRLSEATQLLAVEDAQRKWREEVPQREQTARQTWCKPNPEVGNAEVFYARQYADGRTEWLFCDGHMIYTGAKGGEPTLVSPELSAKDKRKVKPPRYIEAARSYPETEIDKQPTSASAASSAPSAASGH